MSMKSSRLLLLGILAVSLVGAVSAQSEIDAYVVGQDVQGTLSVTAEDVQYDYYHDNFNVSYVYGQNAILEVENTTDNTIDTSNVLRSGEWQNLYSGGNPTSVPGDYDETNEGVQNFTYSHTFDPFSTYNPGEYAFVVMVAQAESEYTTPNASDVNDWSQSDAEWSPPSDTTYEYGDGTYGVNEVARQEYLFSVQAADEPTNVVDALQQFFNDFLLGALVEDISNLFSNANIGVPSIDSPPTGP